MCSPFPCNLQSTYIYSFLTHAQCLLLLLHLQPLQLLLEHSILFIFCLAFLTSWSSFFFTFGRVSSTFVYTNFEIILFSIHLRIFSLVESLITTFKMNKQQFAIFNCIRWQILNCLSVVRNNFC